MAHGHEDWEITPEFKNFEQLLYEQSGYAGYALKSASPTYHPYANLVNPVGSGVICRLTGLYYHVSTAATVELCFLTNAGTLSAYPLFNRYIDGPSPSCVLKIGHESAFTTTPLRINKHTAEASGSFEEISYIIPEGKQISVLAIAAGSQIQAMFEWYEIVP